MAQDNVGIHGGEGNYLLDGTAKTGDFDIADCFGGHLDDCQSSGTLSIEVRRELSSSYGMMLGYASKRYCVAGSVVWFKKLMRSQ